MGRSGTPGTFPRTPSSEWWTASPRSAVQGDNAGVRTRKAIAFLSLVGFLISLYLWLHAIGVVGELKCGTGSCEVVQTSPYARVAGVPVAFFGVLGYVALFVTALVGLQPSFLSKRSPSVLRSEEHTSELQSPCNLVCRLLLEKKKRIGGRTLRT